jgi:regulator of protease activity HflC (stomatin/prohibitin superfamily)
MPPVLLIVILVVLFILIPWLATCVLVVKQKSAALVEVFGRFTAVKMPGLRFKLPWPIALERRYANGSRVNLRLRELKEHVSVKTRDNAFVSFPVAVQYRVMEDKIQEAFYELDDAEAQIVSFVLNVVRTEGAKLTLEELYTAKAHVEIAVQAELEERLKSYGFEIVNVLVDEPQPSQEVQDAFNRVIAAKREMEAAKNEAEAERIRLVGIAEAEKTSKRLQGEGIAAQRLAIADGYHEAMDKLKIAMPHTGEETILAMLMMTNHWDTIRDAANGAGNIIMVNGSGSQATEDLAHMAAAFKVSGPKAA